MILILDLHTWIVGIVWLQEHMGIHGCIVVLHIVGAWDRDILVSVVGVLVPSILQRIHFPQQLGLSRFETRILRAIDQ